MQHEHIFPQPDNELDQLGPRREIALATLPGVLYNPKLKQISGYDVVHNNIEYGARTLHQSETALFAFSGHEMIHFAFSLLSAQEQEKIATTLSKAPGIGDFFRLLTNTYAYSYFSPAAVRKRSERARTVGKQRFVDQEGLFGPHEVFYVDRVILAEEVLAYRNTVPIDKDDDPTSLQNRLVLLQQRAETIVKTLPAELLHKLWEYNLLYIDPSEQLFQLLQNPVFQQAREGHRFSQAQEQS